MIKKGFIFQRREKNSKSREEEESTKDKGKNKNKSPLARNNSPMKLDDLSNGIIEFSFLEES